ncbi:hypothetical protein [Rhodopseudomonas sp.]|uniref:hypothetical protein n=1 Tax=Rhodopseudomonas sp. TaxID=1078 RepID=UPI003B3AAAB2
MGLSVDGEWPAARRDHGEAGCISGPTVISNIERGISEVWERGFCISMGALDPGTNAVGVPYLHPDGRHVLAFNMTASKSILTRKSIETVWAPKLLSMVRAIQGVPIQAPTSGFHSNAPAARDRPRPSRR